MTDHPQVGLVRLTDACAGRVGPRNRLSQRGAGRCVRGLVQVSARASGWGTEATLRSGRCAPYRAKLATTAASLSTSRQRWSVAVSRSHRGYHCDVTPSIPASAHSACPACIRGNPWPQRESGCCVKRRRVARAFNLPRATPAGRSSATETDASVAVGRNRLQILQLVFGDRDLGPFAQRCDELTRDG